MSVNTPDWQQFFKTHGESCFDVNFLDVNRRFNVEDLFQFFKARISAECAINLFPQEPPCGDACPKDEHCDNFGIDGETCPHAQKVQK